MMDRSRIGFTTTPSTETVDPWRVKLFCQAIGATDSAHWDLEATRQSRLEACPVPPTFLRALESDHFSSVALLDLLKVPVRSVLHAEQSFEFLQPVYAGEQLEVKRTIADIYDKRGGVLTFIVVDTEFRRDDTKVCESRQTIVVRNAVDKEKA